MLSEVDPNQSEKMKMATMEVDVEKDSTNGVKYVESVKKEVVATLNNKSEKGAVDTAPVMTDLKNVIDEPAPDAKEVIANATAELVKRDVLSEVDPNQSEKMKMAT